MSVFQDDQPLIGLVQASAVHLIPSLKDSYFGDISDPGTRRAIELLTKRVSNSVSSAVQASGVVEQLDVARRMLRRYPWHGTSITKSNHLELTWLIVQNLCYHFKEKLKLMFNELSLACKLFSITNPAWLKDELREVDQVYGQAIRDRGNTVHGWDQRNDDLFTFQLVELAQQLGLEKDDRRLSDFHGEAKWMMHRKASSYVVAGRRIFLRCLTHPPSPLLVVQEYNKLVDGARQGTMLLRLS